MRALRTTKDFSDLECVRPAPDELALDPEDFVKCKTRSCESLVHKSGYCAECEAGMAEDARDAREDR